MYNDYPTAYETVINNKIIYITIFGIIILLMLLLILFSLGKIYKKANRSAISAWIPIYNILVLLEVVNLPKWYIFLLLIPIVNIFIGIKVYFTLAKLFRKSKPFALGLLFLPVIFYPILAFGSSEYIGINLMAIGGKTQAVDIPIITNDEDKNPIVHEEADTKSENIGISIGGGVYQKDYTNNLLEVDKNQEILKKPDLINSNNMKKSPVDPSKASFITQMPEEPVKEETTPTIGISFPEPLAQVTNTNNELPMQETLKSASTTSLEHPSPATTNTINEMSIFNPVNNISEQKNDISIFNTTSNVPEQKGKIGIFNTTNDTPKQENKSMETPGFITCPKCGAKLKSNVNTCFLCGTKLN